VKSARAALALALPLAAQALPSFEDVRAAHRPSDLTLLDRHGVPLQTLRTDARGGPQRAQDRLAFDRLEPLRVAAETVVGGYAGIGGFVVGRFVAEGTSSLLGVDHEGTLKKLGFVGGVIGGGLATAGTVYAIGNIGDQTGDFDATYLGTGIGFVAALGIAKMVLGPEGRPREGMSTASRWAAANVIALLPSIGATIGFNSTLRHR